MHHFTATVTAYYSRICVYVCDVLVCIAHVIWKLYFQSSLFFVWFCFLLHFLPTISMLKVISNYELCKLTEQHLSARNWCNCFPLYFCKKIKHLRSSLSWLWINQSFTKRFCALIYIYFLLGRADLRQSPLRITEEPELLSMLVPFLYLNLKLTHKYNVISNEKSENGTFIMKYHHHIKFCISWKL